MPARLQAALIHSPASSLRCFGSENYVILSTVVYSLHLVGVWTFGSLTIVYSVAQKVPNYQKNVLNRIKVCQ